MTEQEMELFERRTVELAQARRTIDELRARYTDLSKALSHVLHDSANIEAERDAALNAQEAAEKEVFALRARVASLEALAKRMADDYLKVAPAIDESGEPSAYDVGDKRSPGGRVKVGDKVRFAWPGGEVEGVVDHAWSDGFLYVKSTRTITITPYKRDRILEILEAAP
jgi:hypothetical protein